MKKIHTLGENMYKTYFITDVYQNHQSLRMTKSS